MGVAGLSPPSTRNSSAQSSPTIQPDNAKLAPSRQKPHPRTRPQSTAVNASGHGSRARARQKGTCAKQQQQQQQQQPRGNGRHEQDRSVRAPSAASNVSSHSSGTGSGRADRAHPRRPGIAAPSGDGRGQREAQGPQDEEAEDGTDAYAIGFSQEEWSIEVGGRVVLPTGLEKSLTAQMLHTYETRLFPSAESIEVKRAFIEKFATILVAEFPDWEVDIHVFGSSVNGLGTSRSDVDICLTTEHRELENIFVLNRVLRKYGMRTYCVPRARVPIVKIWDPALRIASDINVNNTIALHNTRMLQTFVALDGRVRPFVMAVKHWTKCREINDAAFGGTLSSYAWVNLAIQFLQTRNPPILPVLHPPAPSLNAERCMDVGDVDLTFDDDILRLREFGAANAESLGFLLYAFFRTYAYEFDYRHQVVSLRSGCFLTKAQKGWDVGRPSRIFCIEEPFSTWLNLGHSANTTSVEGIRQEFQRAFSILRDGGSYDDVCEVYQRPQRTEPMTAPAAPHQHLPPPPLPQATRAQSDVAAVMARVAAAAAAGYIPEEQEQRYMRRSKSFQKHRRQNSNANTNSHRSKLQHRYPSPRTNPSSISQPATPYSNHGYSSPAVDDDYAQFSGSAFAQPSYGVYHSRHYDHTSHSQQHWYASHGAGGDPEFSQHHSPRESEDLEHLLLNSQLASLVVGSSGDEPRDRRE
ncbi:hypothetical protein GGF46_001987 [Coemansia sp. RSA 552]|nr:hypothetical protein GGF46_001987 [Coemansia sp. RSA 552]